MSLTGPMRADSARAHRFCPHVFLGVAGVVLALVGCKSQVQNTATNMGGGVMKGDPPMCFQKRTEARPTTTANNIWVHINNTCSYTVDCMVWDSVTEQEHRMMSPGMQTRSFMVAPEVPQRRVETKFDCTWKP